MKKDFTFIASEVTCNGNVPNCANILTADNMSTIKTMLNIHFMGAPQDVILKELADSDLIDGRWCIGKRAGETDEIIYRMVSGMINYATSKFEGDFQTRKSLAEIWINAQVEMMSAKDMITIMEKALVDCAQADHWYTYEKQY